VLKSHSRFFGMNGLDAAIVQCKGCGIVTRTPSLFSGADMRQLAPPSLRHNPAFIGGGATDSRTAYFDRRLAFAAGRVPGRQLLDIGCGNGSFLRLARQLGWSVTGTEFTQSTVEALHAEGLDCLQGGLDNPALQCRQFDLIHLNHVFEHVEQPVELLRQAAGLLAKGGLILIEVPNDFNGLVQWIKRQLGVNGATHTNFFEHEWFFTPRSLTNTIRQAGLHPQKVFTPWQKAQSRNPLLQALYRAGAALGCGANIEAHIVKK
jgi:SAM-dependent methyltransferase